MCIYIWLYMWKSHFWKKVMCDEVTGLWPKHKNTRFLLFLILPSFRDGQSWENARRQSVGPISFLFPIFFFVFCHLVESLFHSNVLFTTTLRIERARLRDISRLSYIYVVTWCLFLIRDKRNLVKCVLRTYRFWHASTYSLDSL